MHSTHQAGGRGSVVCMAPVRTDSGRAEPAQQGPVRPEPVEGPSQTFFMPFMPIPSVKRSVSAIEKEVFSTRPSLFLRRPSNPRTPQKAENLTIKLPLRDDRVDHLILLPMRRTSVAPLGRSMTACGGGWQKLGERAS